MSAKTTPVALAARDLPTRTTTIYPAAMAKPLEGRKKAALGNAFVLDQFGVNLTTLAPGAWSSHRHWHEAEDEFIYVLDGEITLINDEGRHVLTPGMCAGFKAGAANAHHLVNESAAPASYLEVGTRAAAETAHYPDVDMASGKANGQWWITRKDGSAF